MSLDFGASPANVEQFATMSLSPALKALCLLALAALLEPAWADRDDLWRIVNSRCVPEFVSGQPPLPCVRIRMDPSHRETGWVVLKDRRGALQYLLMPTTLIPGIESPVLTTPAVPNFFAQAWDARDLLDQRQGAPLSREAVSLTVNAVTRRSQDHLHIHISCTRPELLARLLAAQDEIQPTWGPLRGGWLGHRWFVRRAGSLDEVNLFADVAQHVGGADMSAVGIGAVAMAFNDGTNGFVLMATLTDRTDSTSGSAEHDIQDHDCGILKSLRVPDRH